MLKKSIKSEEASNSTNDSGVSDTTIIERPSKKRKTSKHSPTRRWKKGRKQYVCHVCQKQLLGSSDLKKHLRVHTNERPFECKQCLKKFRQSVCLKNHIASIHGTDVKYVCDHCNKSFPIKERLRLHMRVHSGEKPYSCPQCSKTFARGGQLQQHIVTHIGVKKYKCEDCSASFSSPGNLRLHAKTHVEQREFLCHICNKGFYRPDALRKHLTCYHANIKAFHCKICNKTLKGHLHQHMKTHENIRPHVCSICNAQFSQKSQLNVHQRMHSGERPYRCKVCWQAFAHSSVLKLHIRKHTGEKPFKCQLCTERGVAFSQLPHLKTHMRTIHNTDKPYMCEKCKDFFKTKNELQAHTINCLNLDKDQIRNNNQGSPEDEETATLSRLRLLVAVLLKKISTEERLKQLGFEKRLIDNVIISALKLAKRTYHEHKELSEIDLFRLNINEFLEWTIPEPFMKKFKKERTMEELLEDLAAAYTKSSTKNSD